MACLLYNIISHLYILPLLPRSKIPNHHPPTIPALLPAIRFEKKNHGGGTLNLRCGADFVQKHRALPESLSVQEHNGPSPPFPREKCVIPRPPLRLVLS